MTRIAPRTLKGFRDLMPGQALRRARLVRTVEDVFQAHGYGPIDTPALEYAEILKGKGGVESDKELFEFRDKGGREVAMRFDLTVPLARYVAQHQGRLPFPFRRYHTGPVWRGERPQKGRFREFLQCDADLVGAMGAAADAEILLVMAAAFSALDVGPFVVRINDRRVLTGLLERAGAPDLAVPVLRALDKREKQGEEAVQEAMVAAGLPAPAAARLLEVTHPAEDDAATCRRLRDAVGESPLGREGLDSLERIRRVVLAAGVAEGSLRIDPRIARGLDYYTGMVYEIVLTRAPEFGSVGSGGRYDDLAGVYTSTRLPGVGGSVGIDRLLAALEEADPSEEAASPAEVMVAHPEGEQVEPAFRFAADLRARGFSVEVYPEARKHASQMRYADRRKIRFVFTADPDGTFHGKDLATGTTLNVPDASRAAQALRRRVR